MTLAANTRLGLYGIVSPVGAGGMGEVHKAKDTRVEASQSPITIVTNRTAQLQTR